MNSRKVRPALYTFGDVDDFFGAEWRWAQLAEVAEIVGVTSQVVYEAFRPLVNPPSNLYPGTNLHWVSGLDGRPCCGRGIMHREPTDVEIGSMFVSAGFAMDVIKAAELGVVRVVRQEDVGRRPYPSGTLRVYYLMLPSDDRRALPTAPDPVTISVAVIGYDAIGYPVVVPGKEGTEILG